MKATTPAPARRPGASRGRATPLAASKPTSPVAPTSQNSVERAAIGANRQGEARDQSKAERPGMGEDEAQAGARRQRGTVDREGETGQGHLNDEMQLGGLRKIGQAAKGQDEAPDRGAITPDNASHAHCRKRARL